MKSENGETEKLQVVNGEILKSLMALESVFGNRELYFFTKTAVFNNNGMFA